MDIWLIGAGGGVSLSCNWCSVVVFHGSMVNWRRGQDSVCYENYLV